MWGNWKAKPALTITSEIIMICMFVVVAPFVKVVYLLRDTTSNRWYGDWGYIDSEKALAIAHLESLSTGKEILPLPVEVDVTSLSENRVEDFHVLLILDQDNKISYAKAMYPDPLENVRFIDSLLSSPEVGSIKVFKVQINQYVKH